MELHFEPITEENLSLTLALHVASEQEGYVESVSQCLSEAKKRKCWKPVGIYDKDILIGFAMYGFFWEYLPFGRVWLDRFLIDMAYQKKGYGTAALLGLLDRIQKEYRCKKVYLSVVEENIAATKLYQKFGFQFNGQHDVHGENVMVYRYPSIK